MNTPEVFRPIPDPSRAVAAKHDTEPAPTYAQLYMRLQLVLLTLLIVNASCAWGQSTNTVDASASESNLQLRLQQIETQLTTLQQSQSALLVARPDFTFSGLGPVASKIYDPASARWSAGLAADFFSYRRGSGTDRSSVTSVLPTLGIKLHPRLIFNSQLLIENGGAESSDSVSLQKGQVVLQMAYLDWWVNAGKSGGLRVGHQLLPIGLVNSSNEASTYLSVLRPELEREIIPGPWHENGILLWVDRARASFEAGAFCSLNASGFRQSTFLAGGRGQGQQSVCEDVMGVFRLLTRSEHLDAGGSMALGNSAQKSPTIRRGTFQLGEVHLQVHAPRWLIVAMSAVGQLQDADAISIVNSSTIAEQARGNSLEGAFALLHGEQKLWLFSRYSRFNLHDRVANGYTADPSLNKNVRVVGLSYWPLPQLNLKSDFSDQRTASGSKDQSLNFSVNIIY